MIFQKVIMHGQFWLVSLLVMAYTSNANFDYL